MRKSVGYDMSNHRKGRGERRGTSEQKNVGAMNSRGGMNNGYSQGKYNSYNYRPNHDGHSVAY